jgi:hypothetical protein
LGKEHRAPFPQQSTFGAQKGLDLIHAELCGQIRPPTPGGKSYFLLVVDVFSRYLWVEMLKPNDEALAYLKKIMTREENEQGSKLKALRTDREGNSIPICSQYFAHLRTFGCVAHVKDVGPRVTNCLTGQRKWCC